jgi:hypothetical protein
MWPRHLAVDGVAGMRHFELTSGWSPTASTDSRRAMAKADGVDNEAEKSPALDDRGDEADRMEFDDDDDAALVHVLHEVRRAYCRLLSAADSDCSSINAGED